MGRHDSSSDRGDAMSGSNGYNFSERVRRVLAQAREEAARLHHEYVGTEHILLSIIAEEDGVAHAVLEAQGINRGNLKREVDAAVKKGRASHTGPDLPYTSRAKKVLELSMSEARELNHSYVGTEHLLMGLIREEKGIGAQVLAEAGLTLEIARRETLRLLGANPPLPASGREPLGPLILEADSGHPHRTPLIPKPIIASLSIDVFYSDGTVRRESFTSTMAAISFLGAVHRRQMDS